MGRIYGDVVCVGGDVDFGWGLGISEVYSLKSVEGRISPGGTPVFNSFLWDSCVGKMCEG